MKFNISTNYSKITLSKIIFSSGTISDCGKYLIVTGTKDYDSYVVYIADLEKIKFEIKTKLELKPIVSKLEADYTVSIKLQSEFAEINFHQNALKIQ